MQRPLITMEYFRQKIGAVDLINLVNFLTRKKIEDKHLEDKQIVKVILRRGMKTTANANLTESEVNEFQKTILNFKIDEWTKINLYRTNHAILLVACVEHVLAPEKGDEIWMKIYRCGTRSAQMIYKQLLGLAGTIKNGELNPKVVESARTFFRCRMFTEVDGFLATIRSYLKTIVISDEEKIYIRNTSIRLIDKTEITNNLPLQRSNDTETIDNLPPEENNDTETINTIPSRRSNGTETIDTVPLQRSNDTETINTRRLKKCTINQEYFQKKSKADVIIHLVNYLKTNKIKKEDLQKNTVLLKILRDGMKKIVSTKATESKQLDKQLSPIRKLLTARIDMWQAAHLYRVNHGILVVACVEHVLCPGKSNEEYERIYSGDCQKATELYKELCDKPETKKKKPLDPDIVKSAAAFFQCTDKCLESIRSYLREINIDYEEMEYIKKASIELIKSKKYKLSTNMKAPIKCHTINVTTIDKETLPPMPHMPLKQVDPPSVSKPVDKGSIKSNKDKLSTLVRDLLEDHPTNVTTDDEETLPPMPDMQLEHVDSPSVLKPVAKGSIISNEDELSKNMIDSIEYHTINVPIDGEQPHSNMVQITYPEILSSNIDPPSAVSIPVDQELIIINEDELSTNMIDSIECHTINVPIDGEQPHSNMVQITYPEILSSNIDPPSAVSIPVDQGLIISNEDELSTNMIDSIEYHTINVPIDGEQPHSNMVQITYPEMQSLNVDPPSMVSILVDQGLIISNEDELSTNMMDPIEYHTINVPIDGEQPHSNMVQITYPEISSSNVDPPSAVSTPLDQELIIINEDELSTNMIDSIEYHTINVPMDGEQPHSNMVQITYPEISSSNVDPPSAVSIPLDQELIISNEDKLSTNTMDPIEDNPKNVTTDDEETLPPMTHMPLEHVDSPLVSKPVDKGSITSNEDKLSTNMLDTIEDHPINVPIDDEQSRSPPTDVPTVKVYLPSTSMIDLDEYYPISLIRDDENMSSPTPSVLLPGPNVSKVNLFAKVTIPVNQGLIKSNEDKPPTNILNLIEDQPSTSSVVSSENLNSCRLMDELVANLPHNVLDFIDNQADNLPTIDEMPFQSMLDASLVNVGPPPVVSSPSVNQGFLSRYTPNDVVLARRSDSNFWPARITRVQEDLMSVEFFPLLDKTTEVSSEEDVKHITEKGLKETAASLSSDTLRESYDHAIELAYEFKFRQ